MPDKADEEVTVHDEVGNKLTYEKLAWKDWESCVADKTKDAEKRFPEGLVHFLKSNKDADGCEFPLPTTIQAYCWPILISGKDLIGNAKTGSGKTLGYLLPGFIWLRQAVKKRLVDTSVGPAILVLTPTRELCNQVFKDADKFGKPIEMTACCAYGGAPKWEQEQRFRKKPPPDTLIGTPGRLRDFITSGTINVSQCGYCVLDEADRMLEMGFRDSMVTILEKVPRKRQMSMFTATWGKDVQKVAQEFLEDWRLVRVGDEGIRANADISQYVEVCKDDEEKMQCLRWIVKNVQKEHEDGNCLVFCNTKRACGDVASQLGCDQALELHGDRQQWERDEALEKFRNVQVPVLVATDVCSRGLDIRSVKVVVNYDVPRNSEEYIHRIGRTGRAGDAGSAYTLLRPGNRQSEQMAGEIKDLVLKAGQDVPEFLEDVAAGRTPDTSSRPWKLLQGRAANKTGASSSKSASTRSGGSSGSRDSSRSKSSQGGPDMAKLARLAKEAGVPMAQLLELKRGQQNVEKTAAGQRGGGGCSGRGNTWKGSDASNVGGSNWKQGGDNWQPKNDWKNSNWRQKDGQKSKADCGWKADHWSEHRAWSGKKESGIGRCRHSKCKFTVHSSGEHGGYCCMRCRQADEIQRPPEHGKKCERKEFVLQEAEDDGAESDADMVEGAEQSCGSEADVEDHSRGHKRSTPDGGFVEADGEGN